MLFSSSITMRVGLLVGLCCMTAAALGQTTMSIGSDSAGPNGTAVVGLDFTGDGTQRSVTADIFFSDAVLTPQVTTAPTVDGCLAGLPAANQSLLTDCRLVADNQIRIVLTSSDGTSPLVDAPAFGTISFDVAGTATPGTTEIIDGISFDTTPGTAADLVMSDGAVNIVITGSAGFASNPAPTSTIDLGSAVVGNVSADSPSDITVSEVGDQQLQVTAFPFTDNNLNEFSTSAAAFNIDDGGDPMNVPVSCTPRVRGMRTATFEISNNSSNAPNAQYTLECAGLAPKVQVSPLTQDLDVATVAGSSDTDTFTVTNDNSDGFSSSTAVTISLGALSGPMGSTPPTVDVSPLTFNLDPGDDQVVTSECSSDASTTPGTYTLTATVGFTAPGMIVPPEVTVECVVSEIAPGYSSNPAPNSTLVFGQVENGSTSTAQTIQIGNEDSVGSGAAAELDITGAVLSDTTNYSFSPDPSGTMLDAGAMNGAASIDVNCTPESIGTFPGTLTVETNDDDQVYNLTCEGTSNAELTVAPTNAFNGTLNIGTVSPGTTTSGSLTLSNAGTDPLEVSCTLTDENGGVITSTALPDGSDITPEFEITFNGTPPDIAKFEETLECTATTDSMVLASSARGTQQPTFTAVVTVSGRPLVIPTMSRWGLVVMSLMLLLVGGFATRRMMA